MLPKFKLTLYQNYPYSRLYKDVFVRYNSSGTPQIRALQEILNGLPKHEVVAGEGRPWSDFATSIHLAVDLPYFELSKYNYAVFTVEGKTLEQCALNERYFFFIDSIVSHSESSCNVNMHKDVWNSFIYAAKLDRQVMVVRNHTIHDDKLLNLEEEGIPAGYIEPDGRQDIFSVNEYNVTMCVLINSNIAADGGFEAVVGGIYQGVAMQARILKFPHTLAGMQQFQTLLRAIWRDFGPLPVIDVFLAPTFLVNQIPSPTQDAVNLPLQKWTGSYERGVNVMSINRTRIRNLKTLRYPFIRMGIFCGNTSKELDFAHSQYTQLVIEDNGNTRQAWFNFEIQFNLFGTVVPQPCVTCAPRNYKGLPENLPEAIVTEDYPKVGYNGNDVYAAYMAQNGAARAAQMANDDRDLQNFIDRAPLSNTINTIKSGGNALGDALKLNFGGLLNTGADFVNANFDLENSLADAMYTRDVYRPAMRMAEEQALKLTPAEFRGASSPATAIANQEQRFRGMIFRSTNEYLYKVDDFFSEFGYKFNRMLRPWLHKRVIFDYIQTENFATSFEGLQPSTKEYTEFCAIFDAGVKIRHFLPTDYDEYGRNAYSRNYPSWVGGDNNQ